MRRDMGTIGKNVGRFWRFLALAVWLTVGFLLLITPDAVGWDRAPFFVLLWAVPGSTALYGLSQVLSRATGKVFRESTHATA